MAVGLDARNHRKAREVRPARDDRSLGVLFARWRTAAWLGWSIESNWADPFTFIVYSVLRPLAAALTLGWMYRAVAGVALRPQAFASLFLGSAFHEYVTRMAVGMGWLIVEEREEYETMKYLYTSPVGIFTYLLGRTSTKFVLASVGCVLTLTIGWTLLGIRWNWAHLDWALLVPAFATGVVAALAIGVLLAGWALVLPRIAITMIEGVALALQLLCGVIFPIDLLPRGLQELSLALPLTWWYEAMRRLLLGHGSSARLAALGDGTVLAILVALTLLWVVIARLGYAALERRARRLGRLDQTTLF
jgi:ABC-2 type transport system permease protein